LNIAEEDYLKLIYERQTENNQKPVKIKALAEAFNYTVQSVTEMVKKMAEKEYLVFIPYKGVTLTVKGQKEALRMIRAHRVWEVFLAQKLGLSWEDLHEEAEKLEHVTSDEVLNRLYHYLDEPDYCMHGNPIPNEAGIVPKEAHLNLWQADDDMYIIKRVRDDKALLNYLNTIPLSIGDEVSVIHKDHFGKLLTLIINQKQQIMTKNIAEAIFVIEKEEA